MHSLSTLIILNHLLQIVAPTSSTSKNPCDTDDISYSSYLTSNTSSGDQEESYSYCSYVKVSQQQQFPSSIPSSEYAIQDLHVSPSQYACVSIDDILLSPHNLSADIKDCFALRYARVSIDDILLSPHNLSADIKDCFASRYACDTDYAELPRDTAPFFVKNALDSVLFLISASVLLVFVAVGGLAVGYVAYAARSSSSMKESEINVFRRGDTRREFLNAALVYLANDL